MERCEQNIRPVVLVTGGARRIGAALCRTFAAAGWRVAIHCNASVAEAEKLAAELGAEYAAVFPADLCDDCRRESLLEAVKGHFGRIDALVNNASVYTRR